MIRTLLALMSIGVVYHYYKKSQGGNDGPIPGPIAEFMPNFAAGAPSTQYPWIAPQAMRADIIPALNNEPWTQYPQTVTAAAQDVTPVQESLSGLLGDSFEGIGEAWNDLLGAVRVVNTARVVENNLQSVGG